MPVISLFSQESPTPGRPVPLPSSLGPMDLVSRRPGLPSPLMGRFRSCQGLAPGESPSLRYPQAHLGTSWAPFWRMVSFSQGSVPLHPLPMGMGMGSLVRTACPSNTFVENREQFSGSLPIEVLVNQRSPSSSEDEEVPNPAVPSVNEVVPVSASALISVPKSKDTRKGSRERKQTKKWPNE